jgi:hypothetical protein
MFNDLGTPYRFHGIETRHTQGGFHAFANAQIPNELGYHTLHTPRFDRESDAIEACKDAIDLWWTMNGTGCNERWRQPSENTRILKR